MDGFRKTITAVAVIFALLLLTACQGVLEFTLEGGRQPEPTILADAPPEGTGSAPVATPIVEVQSSVAATPSPSPGAASQDTGTETQTPPVSPSTTPSPTSTPAPSPTPTPVRPVVESFAVTPREAAPGDTVTLSWQARGDRATICPSAQFVLFTRADCWQVPMSGTAGYTIPSAASDFRYVDFILTAETSSPASSSTAQVSVALKCLESWFYSTEPQAGICPLEPLHTYAAAQHFQRGLMIWLETPGRYYVFVDQPVHADRDRNRLDIINDPLTITGDTSSTLEPPPGLYAPLSGFGLVWRGDIEQSSGYRQLLGWALDAEFGYDAVLQCDNALPSGGRSWQTCYLRGPEAEVFVLHPLGGWFLQTR